MKKILCMVIALIMVLSMSVVAFADTQSTPSVARVFTSLYNKEFPAGVPYEFTVTTRVNGDSKMENKMVCGSLSFSDPSAVEKLEYDKTGNGDWYDITDKETFGPFEGFPFKDEDIKFRVTFNTPGNYMLTVLIRTPLTVSAGSEVFIRGVSDFTVTEKTAEPTPEPTVNPAPAEDPVIIDLRGEAAAEAETEEANPNTGALVLVPAVVALAAVTGIMVSKKK